MNRTMHRRQSGFNLVELMIAMVIGVFLIGGALTVFVQGSTTQRLSGTLSRVQENARFATEAMVPDLRTAGMWGRTKVSQTIDGRKGGSTELGTIGTDCADRWYADLDNEIEASNDANPWDATCLDDDNYVKGTDILVIRHASTAEAAVLEAGRVYVRTDSSHGELFVGTTVPTAGYGAAVENRALMVHAYYIRPWSYLADDGIPMLRRKILSVESGAPVITDEEVASGISDLQVQFGVDSDGDGSVDMYLEPDSSQLDQDEIRAVRFWLMARAQSVEENFTDEATYSYAVTEFTPKDAYRRLLVSSTVLLRNAFQPTE